MSIPVGAKVSYVVSNVRRTGRVLVWLDELAVLVSQDNTSTTQRVLPESALTLVTSPPPPPPPPPPPAGSISPGQSWQSAYNAAVAGSVLRVLAGNHGVPSLTGSKAVTFLGDEGAVVGKMPGDASNVTFENIDVDTGGTHGESNASSIRAANVTWKNVNVRGSFPSVQTYDGGNGFRWLGGTLTSPGARSVTAGDGEPLWLGADGASIVGVTFGAFVIANTDFHLEDIRIQGADDIAILGCTFTAGSDAGSGHIFITHFQASTSVVKRLKIEDCIFPPVNGTYAIQIHANVGRYDYWVFKNNRFDQPIADVAGNYANLIACGNSGSVPASWKNACA